MGRPKPWSKIKKADHKYNGIPKIPSAKNDGKTKFASDGPAFNRLQEFVVIGLAFGAFGEHGPNVEELIGKIGKGIATVGNNGVCPVSRVKQNALVF